MTEAEALITIVSDIKLAERMWPDLPSWLKLLTALRNRDMAEELADSLGPALMRFVESSSDETLDAMVRTVVNDYVHQQVSSTN